MFGVKVNLRSREVIIISSDSETDGAANDSDLLCMTRKSLRSEEYCVDKSKTIDRIVACYTEKRKKKKLKKKVTTFSYKKKIPEKLNKNKLLGSVRDLTKRRLGLRKFVKPVIHYQHSAIKKALVRSSKLLGANCDQTVNKITNGFSSEGQDSEDEKQKPVTYRSSRIKDESKQAKFLSIKIKQDNFKKVFDGDLELSEICLSCGSTDDVKYSHPLFVGGLCEDHHDMFKEWYFKYDMDGCCSYCSICCMGDHVVICDHSGCGRCYCSSCLDLLVGSGEFDRVSSSSKWLCYFCQEITASEHRLIVKRSDWASGLQHLFINENDTTCYPTPPIPLSVAPANRRPIRVLSLFDGIGTGLLALKQLGLEIGKFVASEIDESAIRLVENRHSCVIHVGDITKLNENDVRRMGPFDLVMGGSPCNDLSGANPKRRGLLDSEGTGCLFFDFFRILNLARPPRNCHCSAESERPFFWLFENVQSMKIVERMRISRFLECDPIHADARAVSAAARPRLFWGNLPHMRQLNLSPAPGDLLTVQSCLEKGRVATVEKLNTITTKPGSLYQGGDRMYPVKHDGKSDVLWCTEIERIFGVPEHYTDVNNLGPKERLALLGRSWSVPVIRQLLAPLKEYFANSKSS